MKFVNQKMRQSKTSLGVMVQLHSSGGRSFAVVCGVEGGGSADTSSFSNNTHHEHHEEASRTNNTRRPGRSPRTRRVRSNPAAAHCLIDWLIDCVNSVLLLPTFPRFFWSLRSALLRRRLRRSIGFPSNRPLPFSFFITRARWVSLQSVLGAPFPILRPVFVSLEEDFRFCLISSSEPIFWKLGFCLIEVLRPARINPWSHRGAVFPAYCALGVIKFGIAPWQVEGGGKIRQFCSCEVCFWNRTERLSSCIFVCHLPELHVAGWLGRVFRDEELRLFVIDRRPASGLLMEY